VSRPGQCGRAGGIMLEGKELEFYLWKINGKQTSNTTRTLQYNRLRVKMNINVQKLFRSPV